MTYDRSKLISLVTMPLTTHYTSIISLKLPIVTSHKSNAFSVFVLKQVFADANVAGMKTNIFFMSLTTEVFNISHIPCSTNILLHGKLTKQSKCTNSILKLIQTKNAEDKKKKMQKIKNPMLSSNWHTLEPMVIHAI